MVHLQMNGFIADNLFQYTAARLIAEELGYALSVSHSLLHPQRNVPHLLSMLNACQHAPLELEGAIYSDPVDYSAHIDKSSFNGYYLDLSAICSQRQPRRIEMRGYFQHYDLIRPHKQRIRDWFAITPDDQGHRLGSNDVVLHIRRGDMLVFGMAMSLSFYTDLLRDMAFDRLFIVGYQLDEDVHRVFAPWQPVYVAGTPLEDLRFMLAASNLLLSNSGFAWWAGFLSQAQKIYWPEMDSSTGVPGLKQRFASLWVDDEARYNRVDNVPYEERDFTLGDIFRARKQLRKKRIFWASRSLLARRLGLDR